jgi:hypothetical protein
VKPQTLLTAPRYAWPRRLRPARLMV